MGITKGMRGWRAVAASLGLAALLLTGANAQGAVTLCSLDVDGNGGGDALTDGLLLIRHLFGFSGDTLTGGALGAGCTRCTGAEIATYLDTAACQTFFDADGNGTRDALTDGLLVIRHLFGFSGTTLTDGALGTGAVRTTGEAIAAWLEAGIQQETPLAIQMRHLINRATFGITPDQLDQLPVLVAADLDTFRDELLEKPGTLASCVDPAEVQDPINSPWAGILRLVDTKVPPGPDGIRDNRALANYAALMAAYDECQLREVLTQFWDNHFSTYYFSVKSKSGADDYQTAQWELAENDAFRLNAFGNFRDLLGISARSPAMLYYLDGVDNIAASPNENYSRELQELHALSVDGGYTPTDVDEVAQAFTGWTVDDVTRQFACDPAKHAFAEPIVLDLGQPEATLPARDPASADCEEAGDWVLDQLAAHPSTHGFICEKLTQLLVNDDPPADVVAACAGAFGANVASPDQIALAVETILTHPVFVDALDYLDKVKTPFELEVGLVRNFALPASAGLYDLAVELEQMSMRLFGRSPPDGYPEVADDWVSSELILQRFRFVAEIAFDTSSNDIFIDPIDFFSVQHGKSTAEEIVDYLLDLALANEHGTLERDQALAVLNEGSAFNIAGADATLKLRRMLAIVLNYPGYQYQ